jgi:DNA-binding YbaB/EbfC family protein
MLNPKMMKQMQQMQKKMQQMQDDLANEKVEATAGGGAVKVVASGQQEVLEIKIEKDAVDPEDVEMLEETVLAAVREALEKSKELAQARMGSLTGGMGLPF